jgi:ABC-type Zn uptake system ZnuABC Zn-binding protein ZnuA
MIKHPIIHLSALCLVILSSIAGCKEVPQSTDGKKRVVATTTMIEDLAREIGGDLFVVDGIMSAGGDPHLYKPTPGDATLIAKSELVLTNGLKLEGWIDDLVRNAGGEGRVVEVTEGIEALQDPAKTNYPDPHVWHDVTKWVEAARNVGKALTATSPEHEEKILAKTNDYIERLKKLDRDILDAVQEIPEGRRVLITSHDAFQYYGKRYGLQVLAVQGLSTEAEAGARDLVRVVETVRKRKVPAIFVESSVNPKLIEQISRETGAQIGGTLFSDSLGDKAGPGGTYIGMLETNTKVIVDALSQKVAEPAPEKK